MSEKVIDALALLKLTNGSSAKTLPLLADPDPLDSFDTAAAEAARQWAAEEAERCGQAGVQLILFGTAKYPEQLATIGSPPPLLYLKGNSALLKERRAVAVVGTRQPSTYGATAARTLSRELAGRGFSIVSGLARGVDSEGHLGALEGKGRTVAILGNGLGRIYPSENAGLAERILAEGGALLSERPFDASVEPRYLIARNRLQSGLSLAVLVIETALSGGTPHTARFALEQGRPIWCPAPRSSRPENAGVSALLELEPAKLPETLKAFASAKKLCAAAGQEPIAQAVERDSMAEFFAALDKLAVEADSL